MIKDEEQGLVKHEKNFFLSNLDLRFSIKDMKILEKKRHDIRLRMKNKNTIREEKNSFNH